MPIGVIIAKEKELKDKYGLEYKVVAISDPFKGAICNKNGLKLGEILNLVKELDGGMEGRIRILC